MPYKLILTIPEIPPAWVRRLPAECGDELGLTPAAEDGLRHAVCGWVAPTPGDEWQYRYDIVHTPDPWEAGDTAIYRGQEVAVIAVHGGDAWVIPNDDGPILEHGWVAALADLRPTGR